MKNRLLPLLFVLGSYSAYSQVVIGKKDPNLSAQLEVFANDRGMLIPRVALTDSKDATTIQNGNVNSLLVFNTATVADIKPGYYYWYIDRWCRMAISGEANGIAGGTGAPGNKGEAGYPGEGVNLYTDNNSGTVYVQNANGTWTAINGKNGLDGKNGISGGEGLPGDKGLDATIQMYVDYKTGVVYVRDPEDKTKWVPLNGKNGLDGKNGISGGEGLPGDKGLDATIQMYVDYKTGIVYVRDPEDNTKWVPLNGKNGLDGKNGISGGEGLPGDKGLDATIQMYVDYKTGIVYVRDPEDNTKWVPLNGKNGLDGKNGISGGEGLPGDKGLDATIQMYVDYKTGIVYVRDPEDNTKWVPLNGKNGLDGKNGISGGEGLPGDKGLDATIQMYVDYTTGIVYVRDPKDNTKWVPLNGNDGIPGVVGPPGTPGAITTLDAIIKDPNGNIYAYVGNDKTVAGRDKEWAEKSIYWVKINGLNGTDGIPGATGEKGKDGKITTLDAIIKYGSDIYAYVGTATTPEERTSEWNSGSTVWVKINGLNGTNGIAGATGEKGKDGKITTLDAIIKYGSDIYAYVGTATTPEERTSEWNSGSTAWVKINGLNGANGIPGATGEKGTDGKITTLDAIIKYGNDIYAYVGTATTPEERTSEWNSGSANWVKISGTNGIDGKNGIAGGYGLPEEQTPALDSTIQMYIDYTTGTVYVRDPKDPNKWTDINGIDGIPGVPGKPGQAGSITTLDAIVKDADGNIYAYVGADKTVAGRDKEWAEKSIYWVKINGLNGTDGIPGATGEKGKDGKITTLDAIIKYGSDIYAYVGTATTPEERTSEWNSGSTAWVKINGLNGTNGIAGATGEKGKDGKITTLDAIIKYGSDIYAYVGTATTPEERTSEWNSGSTAWVKINGLNGANGIPGATGEKGTDGKITTLDAIIKYGNDIYAYVGTATTPEERTSEWNSGSANWVKISGTNGIDGKNGIAGGYGLPEEQTPALDSTIQMYIDYTTGTVYVRDPKDPNKWTDINGIDGIPGVPGKPGQAGSITTLDAIVKDADGNIYAYVGADKTVAGRDKEWAEKSIYWVKINGLNGTDGIPGATGEKGKDGKITTLDAIIKYGSDIYAYVGTATTPEERTSEWNSGSTAWVKINGLNGTNGIAGATGEKGKDGKITTLDAIIKYGSDIYAYVGTATTPEERTSEWNSGSTAWVKINGLNGANGIPGATGEKGTDGKITTLDAIIKYGSDIYAYVGTAMTPEERTSEWNSGSTAWVKINGQAGAKGETGEAGKSAYDIWKELPVNDGKSETEFLASLKGETGVAGVQGATGASFTFNDFTKEQLDGLKGETGAQGATGASFTFNDFTKEQLDGLKGETGAQGATGASFTFNDFTKEQLDGLKGETGAQGATGASFTFNDFTKEQLDGLKGETGAQGATGASFTFNDFTKEQLDGLRGETGAQGATGASFTFNDFTKEQLDGLKGETGAQGATGASFTFNDFTKEQLDGLRGETGAQGATGASFTFNDFTKEQLDGLKGETGAQGATGASFTFNDFTKEQLDGLKGETGAQGATGASFTFNDFTKEQLDGLKGETGAQGATGASFTFNDFTKEQLDGLKGETGAQGATGASFTFNDFTKEQLDGLKGETGAQGATGASFTFNDFTKEQLDGLRGETGAQGATGASFTFNDFTKEQLDGLKGETGAQGVTGAKGDTGTDGVTSFVPVVTTGNTIATYTDKDGNPAEIKETVTSLEVGSDKDGNPTLLYTNESGNGINLPVAMFETQTELHNDGLGQYTYTNESKTESKIDIVQDVADFFPNILHRERTDKGQVVYDAIKTIVKVEQTVTSLTQDKDANTLTYKDEYGNPSVIDLNDLVVPETPTTLAHDATAKTLVYTGEKEKDIINLKDITTTTSDKVLAVTGTGATFTDATVNIVPSTVEGDVLTTSKNEQGELNVEWKAPVKTNVMGIQVTSNDYTVTAEDYTIIARQLTGDIKITLPAAADNKGRLLVINQLAVSKPDPANLGTNIPIVVRFNVPVIYSDTDSLNYLAASLFGGVTNGSAKVTLQSDGVNWYAITYTM